jgi:hypothetical protein
MGLGATAPVSSEVKTGRVFLLTCDTSALVPTHHKISVIAEFLFSSLTSRHIRAACSRTSDVSLTIC